ncbi:hypothetical protein ACIQI8_44095 [Streptomyces sp. NPDC092369]|uniref:hypothetical protein n=1 Tax=Streptomyces sp. NPDC092369 TaxID=3366015 RepID=UPI00380D4664
MLARVAVEWVKDRTRDVTLKVVRQSGESFEVALLVYRAEWVGVREGRAALCADHQGSLGEWWLVLCRGRGGFWV